MERSFYQNTSPFPMYLGTSINNPLDEALLACVDAPSVSDHPSLGLAALTLLPTQGDNAPGSSESGRAKMLGKLSYHEKVMSNGTRTMEGWRKSFELAEQEHLFQDLTELETLKKKTNGHLIQSQFDGLVKFTKAIKSRFAEFQALRKSFHDRISATDTTVPQQVQAIEKLRGELKNNQAMLGKDADIILNCLSKMNEFQNTCVQETQDKIDAMLNAEYNQQEDIQLMLDFVKDGERMTPKIKVEPSGLATTLLEVAGRCGSLTLTKRYKNKWLGSKIIQSTYEAEKSKTDALDQKLQDCQRNLSLSHAAWMDLSWDIYKQIFSASRAATSDYTTDSYAEIVNALDAAERQLLTVMQMIEECLAKITEDYGVDLSKLESKGICSRVPNIFTALELLLSAKEVVADEHQHVYEEHIREVCKTTVEHFEKMKDLHWNCPDATKEERRATFLRDDVPKFRQGVFPRLVEITDITKAHISQKKSKEAYQKRLKADGHHGDSAWTRPRRELVTSEEISWALYKAIDALMLIHMISSGPNTPTDQNSIRPEEIPAKPEWLKMSPEMKNKFYAVLYGEVEKLKSIQERANEKSKTNQEPELTGPFSRLRRLMTRTKHSPPIISVH